MLFRIKTFSGVIPRADTKLLEVHQAQSAENCRTWSGKAVPFNQPGAPVALSKPGPLIGLYLYKGQFWFHWPSDVDVVESPIANNTQNRVYYTGDGVPKMTDDTIALSGGTNYPMNSVILGIPDPALPPTHNNPAPSDPNVVQTRAYVFTLVRRWNGIDEESKPSAASALSTVTPGDAVTVTFNTTAPPSGNYTPAGAVWLKRLYRANTGTSGAAFQFLTEVDITTPTYNDTLLSEALNEVLSTENYDPAPDEMIGLVSMPNGIVVGFRENEIIPSEAYQPHTYPIPYRLSTKYKIVAMAVFGHSVVIGTTEKPYILTGVIPEALTLEEVDIRQACVSKRSMVDMGEYVMYASPDGLVAVGRGIAKVITEDFFTRNEWQGYQPETIHGYFWDGRYVGYYGNGAGGFIFDPGEGSASFMPLSDYFQSGYADIETDTLYVLSGQNIAAWDAGTAALQQRWKTGVMVAGKPTNPGAARVIGLQTLANPTVFSLWADGSLVHIQSCPDSKAFRLPSVYGLAEFFEIEVSGKTKVDEILISHSMTELNQA